MKNKNSKKKELVGWQPVKSLTPGMLSGQELAIAFSQNDDNLVDFLLIHGGRGDGKSVTGLYCYFQHVGQGYGETWAGLVIRPQFGALKSIFSLAKDMCEKLFNKEDYTILDSNDAKMIKFNTGETLTFNYMFNEVDFENKYKGYSFSCIIIEEITTFSGMWVLAKIRTCLRSTVAKNGRMPPLMIRATTNPTGTPNGHKEVKEQVIYRSEPGELLEITMENPFNDGEILKTTQMHIRTNFTENIHLPSSYLAQFIQLKESNYKQFQMEVLGMWDVKQDGCLFNEVLDEDLVFINKFKIPRTPIYRAFDYGSHDPFCMLYYIVVDKNMALNINNKYVYFPENTIIIIDEIYGAKSLKEPNKGLNISDIELVELIKNKEKKLREYYNTIIKPGPCDDILKRGEKNGNRTKYDYFKENGITFNRAIKKSGSIEVGCDLINESLYSVKYGLKEPQIYIFKNCEFTIQTVFNLQSDEVNPSKPIEGQADHALDVLRYIKLEKNTKTKVSPL